jgi:hypothetical protein
MNAASYEEQDLARITRNCTPKQLRFLADTCAKWAVEIRVRLELQKSRPKGATRVPIQLRAGRSFRWN